MRSAGHITVGFDDSPGGRAALVWTLDEAARLGGTVRLVFAFDLPAFPAGMGYPIGWPDQESLDEAARMLDKTIMEAFVTHPEVPITRSVIRGAAARVLEDLSRTSRMVVLGSHGHGGFTGMLLGSTGASVAAHAHCPVVVARRSAAANGPIVVGLDGSPASRPALEYALTAAAAHHTPLRAIRVWTPPGAMWSPPGFDIAAVTDGEQRALDIDIADRAGAYPDVRITSEVRQGSPAGVLAEAGRAARLVVVGTRGRGGFAGLLLGSVSQQLLHHAPCPVAVVREFAQVPPDVDH